MTEPAGLLAVTKVTGYRRAVQSTNTTRKNYVRGFRGERAGQIV